MLQSNKIIFVLPKNGDSRVKRRRYQCGTKHCSKRWGQVECLGGVWHSIEDQGVVVYSMDTLGLCFV